MTLTWPNVRISPKIVLICCLAGAIMLPALAANAAFVTDDSITTGTNTPVTFDPTVNDSGTWIGGSWTQGSTGSVAATGQGAVLRYTPNSGFEGADSFTYTLEEADGSFHTATVTVDVQPATVFVTDDSASTDINTAITIDVLANDNGTWVAVSWAQGSNGSVAPTPANTLNYTPNTGFVGTDTFTYTVTDVGGAVLTATVTVMVETTTVEGPTFTDVTVAAGIAHIHHLLMPDPQGFPGGPYALKDLATTTVNTPVTIDVTLNDVGNWVGGQWLDPANGIVAAGSSGGELIYSPNGSFEGADSFDYTIDEAGGESHTATVAIDVVVDASPGRFLMTDFLPAAVAAGDYDNDGNTDLYFTILDGPDILYRNNGDGTFSDVAAAAGINRGDGSSGAGWADIDNDGDLDLYVTAVSAYRYYLYINNGDGTFTEDAVARGAAVEGGDTHYGMSVSFGDYDSNGYLDIHLCEWRLDSMNLDNALSNSRLLRNLGSASPGNFEDVTAAAGVALDDVMGLLTSRPRDGTFSFSSRFTDLDNDGNLDLVIAADFGESRLFWNNGDGTFTDGTLSSGVGTDENGMGHTVGDVNGDGLQDWFVTAISGGAATNHTGNRLFINNGDRTFTDNTDVAGVRTGYWGWGATFFDYDNDGDQDLAMVNGVDFPVPNNEGGFENDPIRLWRNDGTGVFTEISAPVGLVNNYSGKGLLKFDYDSDGDLDLLVTNNGGTPHGGAGRGKAVLYRNDGGNDNDWIRVSTSGSMPGAGARVTVTASPGANPQVQEIHAGNNFMSQDPSVAHFGLGTGIDPVHEVRIEWPDGTVQVRQDVPRNSTVSFEHP